MKCGYIYNIYGIILARARLIFGPLRVFRDDTDTRYVAIYIVLDDSHCTCNRTRTYCSSITFKSGWPHVIRGQRICKTLPTRKPSFFGSRFVILYFMYLGDICARVRMTMSMSMTTEDHRSVSV